MIYNIYESMRKNILIIILLITVCVNGQVGIGTENPQGYLHIDAKQNTNGTSNISDDFIIDSTTGNVGLGIKPSTTDKLLINGSSNITGDANKNETEIIEQNAVTEKLGINDVVNPTHRIHIKTNKEKLFRLSDGSEKTGSLLTTDTNGNVYWEPMKPLASIIEGSLASGRVVPSGDDGISSTNITDKNLILTPGKWMVFARAVTVGNLEGFSMYIELREDDGSVQGKKITRRGAYAEKNTPYTSVIPLTFIIDVKADTPTKIYKIHLASSRSGTTTNSNAFAGKMYFYALRIDRDNTPKIP